MPVSEPPFLSLSSISKHYGRAAALRDVSIGIDSGSFVTLLGPSGSGKSTALMAIAGFVIPDEGKIRFDGADITQMPPEKRGFGVVFQGYALFPHMTVARNIAYPLEVRGVSRSDIEARVRRVLDLVQLDRFADREPTTLSGGQQQRVAIARALVYEPPLLLLDEPLSALDRKLRSELQGELKALHNRLGTTFVNVTHDQDEALALSTSVVLLSQGRVLQQDSPGRIYDLPDTAFVADFIGNANLIRLDRVVGNLQASGGSCGHRIHFARRYPDEGGATATLAVRQEAMEVLPTPPGDGRNWLACTVISHERVGPVRRILVEAEGVGPLRTQCAASAGPSLTVGDRGFVAWSPEATIHVRDDLASPAMARSAASVE